MNEVRFKIGADTSSLSRGFVQAGSIAASAGKALNRKFGLQDAFKSGVLALGLSIEKIAEQVAEMFTGGAQESWKAALQSAQEAARTIEESTRARMSTLRQIADIEADIRRNSAAEQPAPKKTRTEPGFVRRTLDAIGETMFSKGADFMRAIGAKNAVEPFKRSAEDFRRRGEGEEVEETPAEAHARSQAATAKRLADEAKIEELREKAQKTQDRIAEARRDLDATGLDDQGKINALFKEAEIIGNRLEAARRKGADTAELELEFIAKMKQAKQAIVELDQKHAREQKEADEKRERALEKQRDLLQDQADARNNVADAAKGVADQQHDQLGFSVQDAASGKRGSGSDRAKAREILRLEKQARRIFDSNSDILDPTGKHELSGEMVQGRANQLRGQFSRLKTDEQNPFAGAEKQLETANAHLATIEASLAKVKVQ